MWRATVSKHRRLNSLRCRRARSAQRERRRGEFKFQFIYDSLMATIYVSAVKREFFQTITFALYRKIITICQTPTTTTTIPPLFLHQNLITPPLNVSFKDFFFCPQKSWTWRCLRSLNASSPENAFGNSKCSRRQTQSVTIQAFFFTQIVQLRFLECQIDSLSSPFFLFLPLLLLIRVL